MKIGVDLDKPIEYATPNLDMLASMGLLDAQGRPKPKEIKTVKQFKLLEDEKDKIPANLFQGGEGECSICQDVFDGYENIEMVGCKHRFHVECF
jgi:hypothetical protein